MPQAGLLADFTRAVEFARKIIVDAHATDGNGQFVHAADVRAFMTEAAVLKIYMAWERYLEQSFLGFLMGVPSTAGVRVTCYLRPTTLEHARRVLIGTQRYVDWSNPQIVKRLAELYFEKGEPYWRTLSSIEVDLFDLRAIRNAAAHLSTSTSDQLDQLALRKLGRATTGVTVYDLVTAPDAHIAGKTVLEGYIEALEAAASLIAKAE